MNIIENYYIKLGIVGIPLLVIALLSVFIGIKVYSKLWMLDFQFRRFFKRVDAGDHSLLYKTTSNKNPLICIVRDVVNRHRYHSKDLRSEVIYLFHKYFYATKRNFTTLRLIAVSAPLLGLLGTVIGIIQVFEAIGVGASLGADNQALAIGIGQALYTTVFGIVIAIPTLVALYYLKHKLLGYVIMVTEFSYRATSIAEADDLEKNKKD